MLQTFAQKMSFNLLTNKKKKIHMVMVTVLKNLGRVGTLYFLFISTEIPFKCIKLYISQKM